MASWTLPDALKLLHQSYPGAFVTSGYRDPNSKLGKANPRSYHNHGQAFDIRPMQGVEFNDYVGKLKAAGLPVAEALDEQKKPMPWTTGPNWHIAFGGQKKDMPNPMMDPAQRAKMFNVNIPPEQPQQQPFDLQQALAGVGDQILGPQLHASEPQPEEKKGIPMWAKILGVLGDSYTNIHGGHGAFIPAMQDRQRAEDDRNLARERLQQQIDAQRELLAAKLSAPQKPTQTDRYVQEVLDPNTDPRRAALLRSILTHPMGIPIYGADGSQAMQYSYPDQMGGGDDEWEYSN